MPESNFNNVIMVYSGFKVMRIIFSYVSLLIAKNFTSQIYLEKVLVFGENPPKLTNFLYLYFILELVMTLIFLAIIYASDSAFDLKLNSGSHNLFTDYVLPDLCISYVMLFVIGNIVSSKMYEKKYFLYKDDGLRAIRALSEMMFAFSAFIYIIPFNYLLTGIISAIKLHI